ncbi:CrcB family protein [Cryobacterium sp. 1639]|uniref:CrcB family protein n=1 Tax=Cryobacterium inferilacus TaxID=2866629 RepID=UPI001C7306BE|nr:CrcB family protein [Cryobacterium sp. 1639]MBX0299122.1 CrcB family protein [Cryobacterium sp. 1639]
MFAPGALPRPVHLRWPYLALVFAGGTVGTALRELLAISVPPVAGVAVVIVGINVVGAFLLGLLLETLAGLGADEGRRRQLRLFLGTGLLGGFTTYSALATDTGLLLADDRLGTAVLYALGTVVVGALASWAGIAAGAALHRRRTGTARSVAS